MIRFRFLFSIVLFLGCCFSCNRDHSEMSILKEYLTSDKNTHHLQRITYSVDLFRLGYDNPVPEKQLDSLRQATDAYLVFLKSHHVTDKTVRQRQQEVIKPVTQFRQRLMDLRMRLDAFRVVHMQLDSLSQAGNKVDIHQLERRERALRRSITTRELIRHTIKMLQQVTRAIKRLGS